jgi:hypothetical protein
MVTAAWDIEYALYHYRGRFEEPLVESLLRQPSDFTLRVLCRMLARGWTQIGPWSVIELLQGVVRRAETPEVLRSLARRNIRWHREDQAEPLVAADSCHDGIAFGEGSAGGRCG